MSTITQFFCHTPECSLYGLRNQGNLSFCGWSGHSRTIRMIRCNKCKHSYSARKGTVLEHSRLPQAKGVSVLAHIQERCGVRATNRLTGVSQGAIIRLSRKAGEHAKQMHDELVSVSPQTKEVQLDEKWSFVGKKTKLVQKRSN